MICEYQIGLFAVVQRHWQPAYFLRRGCQATKGQWIEWLKQMPRCQESPIHAEGSESACCGRSIQTQKQWKHELRFQAVAHRTADWLLRCYASASSSPLN